MKTSILLTTLDNARADGDAGALLRHADRCQRYARLSADGQVARALTAVALAARAAAWSVTGWQSGNAASQVVSERQAATRRTTARFMVAGLLARRR